MPGPADPPPTIIDTIIPQTCYHTLHTISPHDHDPDDASPHHSLAMRSCMPPAPAISRPHARPAMRRFSSRRLA